VRAQFQYYEELEAVHQGSNTMPAIPEYPAINEVLSRMTWDAVQGRKSVADALRDAAVECQAILAHYRER
jgi:maltose-binding protein MalE